MGTKNNLFVGLLTFVSFIEVNATNLTNLQGFVKSDDIFKYVKPRNFTNQSIQIKNLELTCELSQLMEMKYLKTKADSIRKDTINSAGDNILKIDNQKLKYYLICKISGLELTMNFTSILILTFDTVGQTEYYILNVDSKNNLISMFCIFKEDFNNRKYLLLKNIGNTVNLVIFTESIEPNCIKNNPVYLYNSNDIQDIYILERNFEKQNFSIKMDKNGKLIFE